MGAGIRDTQATPDARARGGGGLIPQPHGGALAPPFAPGSGVTMGASRRGTSMRAVRRQCRELLADACEANTRRLLELCQDPDPRVAVVAIKECNDRLWGRVGDKGWAADDDAELKCRNLEELTDAELEEIVAAELTLLRLTGAGFDPETRGTLKALTPEEAYRLMIDGKLPHKYVVSPERAKSIEEWTAGRSASGS